MQMYVLPWGSDSDLSAHSSRPAHAARCVCSLHIWLSEQDLDRFKLHNTKTRHISQIFLHFNYIYMYDTEKLKIKIRFTYIIRKVKNFVFSRLPTSPTRAQIRKPTSEQAECTSPQRDPLVTDLQIAQYRVPVSPPHSAHSQRQTGVTVTHISQAGLAPLPSAEGAEVELVCTVTGQPVMQQKPQEPTQCLPCPSPSLLLATTHAILPSISHPQPREEPVSGLRTTKGTYTTVTGAAHKARAAARMCPIPREKPAADMHTLQIAANSSDNCITWFCSALREKLSFISNNAHIQHISQCRQRMYKRVDKQTQKPPQQRVQLEHGAE